MAHTHEDSWAVVYPGDNFPKGAVRALNRGLKCQDSDSCDSYVALWIREDGESVFGRAWNCDGKVKAVFPYGGKVVTEAETKGFRILTYIGPPTKNNFEYRWVRENEADVKKLLYIGEYVSCVVQCEEGGEALGKANPSRKMAWTCMNGQEVFHQGEEYNYCYLLCKECYEEVHTLIITRNHIC